MTHKTKVNRNKQTNKVSKATSKMIGVVVQYELSHAEAQEALSNAEKVLSERSYHLSIKKENTTAENSDVNDSKICAADQSDESVAVVRIDIDTNLEELEEKSNQAIIAIEKLKVSLTDLNEFKLDLTQL